MNTEHIVRRTSKWILLLVMWGFVSIVVLHEIEPGYTVANNFVSEYARSAHGYLMSIAFVVLGASAVLLSLLMGDLKLVKPADWLILRLGKSGATLWPLLLAGVFVALLAAFPTDVTNPAWWRPVPPGVIPKPSLIPTPMPLGVSNVTHFSIAWVHGTMTTTGFALAIVSMLAFTLEFDFNPHRWAWLKLPNFFLLCFTLPSLAAYALLIAIAPIKPILGLGFTERLMIFSFIAWIIMVDCAYLMHPRTSIREEHLHLPVNDPEVDGIRLTSPPAQ